MSEAPLEDPRLRIPSNLGSSLLIFTANAAVSFWLTPFLLSKIGLESFGLVQLAAQVAGYASTVLIAFSETGRRHLARLLELGDLEGGRRIFSATLLLMAACSAILAPVFLLIAAFPDFFFTLPPGLLPQARAIMLLSFAAQVAGVWGNANAAVLSAKNRLDLVNLVSLGSLFGKIGTILFFTARGELSILTVGAALLVDRLSFWAGSAVLRRRLVPKLRGRLLGGGGSIRRILPLGLWLFADHLGVIVLLNAEIVLANRLFGTRGAGQYASLLQLVGPFRSISGILTGALVPVIAILQARGAQRELGVSVTRWIRIIGLILALPAGLVCGLSLPLLTLWLGPDFSQLWPVLVILVVLVPLNLSVGPTISLAIAHGRFEVPALATLVSGAVYLALAFGFSAWTNLGLAGIAIAAVGSLTIKNLLVNGPYTDRLSGLTLGSTSAAFGVGFFWTLLAGGASALIAKFIPVDSWSRLILTGTAVSMVYLPTAWALGFNEKDRRAIKEILTSRFTDPRKRTGP